MFILAIFTPLQACSKAGRQSGRNWRGELLDQGSQKAERKGRRQEGRQTALSYAPVTTPAAQAPTPNITFSCSTPMIQLLFKSPLWSTEAMGWHLDVQHNRDHFICKRDLLRVSNSHFMPSLLFNDFTSNSSSYIE